MSIELGSRPATTADTKLVGIIRNELLIAKEMLKDISRALRALEGEESISELFEEIRKSKERADLLQKDFLDYFSRIAPSLYSKEEWLRVFSKTSGMLDKLSGITYRVEYLVSKSWKVPAHVRSALAEMVSMLISMMDEYITMVNALTRGNAVESRRRVSGMEADIDAKYRATTFAVLEADLPPPLMSLLLSIAEMLEDVSDLIDSAADDVYLLALA